MVFDKNRLNMLKSKKGNKVYFNPPKGASDAEPIEGQIVDELWIDEDLLTSVKRDPENDNDWGDYAYFAQKIEWKDQTVSIRLGYYQRSPKSSDWKFGSQWTVEDSPDVIKKLCEATLAKSEWFKEEGEQGSGGNG